MSEVKEPEVVESDLEGTELPNKSDSFQSLVRQIESSDEMLADPDFDPAPIVAALKTKVDSIEFFLQWAKDRREYYKRMAQEFQKTGTALQATVDKVRERCAEVMDAESVTTYPGNKRRMDLMRNADRFSIDAEPNAVWHMKHPKLCKSVKTYQWDLDACKAMHDDGKLPKEIGSAKRSTPFIKFFNNSNIKKEKGVKKVTKKTGVKK